MANNALVKTLLRSVMPTVQKFVDSGKIDTLFRELKERYKPYLSTQNNTVEILVTTEEDGLEYVNMVEMDLDLRVTQVLGQQRLSDLIKTLFTQAEL